MYDMTSLLLGAAISGTGLCLTMLALVSADRKSHFKVNWAIGAALFVLHVFAYWFFSHGAPQAVGALACALQVVGAAFICASVRQFMDDGFRPLRFVLRVCIPYLLVVPPVFAVGYDGIALVAQNAATASLLLFGGITYLRNRHDAPLALGVLAGLYGLAGLSFALCGLVILIDGNWSIGYPPQNWAEELNVVISVLTLTGAGALTLSVDQIRLAKLNQKSAMSDPLTGLLNRRGLVSARTGPFGTQEAIVLFDLDHFKQINDRHGHATGDLVIRTFADTLRRCGRKADHKVRLGGEEFAMVMQDVTPKRARDIAERVSAAFAEIDMVSNEGELFRCTVSAGIAFGHAGGSSLDEVVVRADRALYAAKRDGRNRVVAGDLRLAS